jgi:membrane protein
VINLKRIAGQWIAHDNTRSAAAIAYYAVFSLAPTLVFVTYALGYLVGNENARALAEDRLADTIGPAGAEIAHNVFENSDKFRYGGVTAIAAGLLVLYGASSMFYQLRAAFDRIFGKPHRSPRAAFLAALLGRAIAALVVILAGGLLVATLFAQVVLHGLSDQLFGKTELLDNAWHFGAYLGEVAAVSMVFIALLRFLPSQPPAWRHVWLGAAATVVLFEVGKWLIGVYISRSVIASAYGPSSAIVAFIVWIYYSAQTLLLGAEVCHLQQTNKADRSSQNTPNK